jgi:hypothetical protein
MFKHKYIFFSTVMQDQGVLVDSSYMRKTSARTYPSWIDGGETNFLLDWIWTLVREHLLNATFIFRNTSMRVGSEVSKNNNLTKAICVRVTCNTCKRKVIYVYTLIYNVYLYKCALSHVFFSKTIGFRIQSNLDYTDLCSADLCFERTYSLPPNY